MYCYSILYNTWKACFYSLQLKGISSPKNMKSLQAQIIPDFSSAQHKILYFAHVSHSRMHYSYHLSVLYE